MATTSVGQPLRSVGEPGVRATQAPNAGDLATEEGHAGVPNFTRTNSKETLSRLKHQRAGSPESCSSARLNLRQNRSVHYEDDEAFHNSMFGEPRNSPARTDMSDDPFRQERLQYFASQLVQYDYGKGRKNSIIIDGVTFEGLGSVKDALESRRLENMHRRGPLHELAWFVEAGTFVIFAVASVVMVTLWAVEHEQADAFVTTFFVTAIAAAAYFAKTCHMGDFKIHDNWVPIARYIDWITTTPLMLYELCHIGQAYTHTVITVIGADVLMLSTGIIAAVLDAKKHWWLKLVWFLIAVLFYAMLVCTLQVDVSRGTVQKSSDTVQDLFRRLEILTVVTWSFYPIVCLLGRAHLGVISQGMEDILLSLLDVLSKVGMDGLIVVTCGSGHCTHEDLDEGGGH